jgi:hypothetical protein
MYIEIISQQVEPSQLVKIIALHLDDGSIAKYHFTIHHPCDVHIQADTGIRKKCKVRLGLWNGKWVHNACQNGRYRLEWDNELVFIWDNIVRPVIPIKCPINPVNLDNNCGQYRPY